MSHGPQRQQAIRAFALSTTAALALAAPTRAAVEGPFTFTNNTGFKADKFNSVFTGTGGTLHNIDVTATPVPNTFSSVGVGNEVILGWTAPNLLNTGQSITFTVQSDIAGIALNSSYFSKNGVPITIYWPFAATPNTAQNYGNFPNYNPQQLHSSLDIAAPIDTPVRAMVSGTIVAVAGNYVSVSDGTNVYNYAHIKKVSGATSRGFTAADVGTTVTAGQNFAFVLGAANRGGGSFDHLDLEFIPGKGTDAFLKVPDPANPGQYLGYKTAAQQAAITDPARVNPLVYLPLPERDPGNNTPTIGPMFFQPRGGNVAGYTEFGQDPATPGLRAGTFVNGQLDLIQEIRDDQGAEPFKGTRNDPIDPTIKVYNGVMANPYKVSYQVQGQGVVAGNNINERTLVQFDGPWGTQNATSIAQETYDPRRNTTTANTSARNYSYVLTNTDGTNPSKDNVWNTMAKKGGVAGTDGTGRPDALNNADAKFPDGVYEPRGFGFDIADDGTPGHKTSIPYKVRVNNWKQTAVPTTGFGSGTSNPVRADDTFDKDGAEFSTSAPSLTYDLTDEIFGSGDNYLPGQICTWYIFDHRVSWFNDDTLVAPLATGSLDAADANGFVAGSFLTFGSSLGVGEYDLVFDYDANAAYSWTLDGLGSFDVIPEPTTLSFTLLALTATLSGRRRHASRRGRA